MQADFSSIHSLKIKEQLMSLESLRVPIDQERHARCTAQSANATSPIYGEGMGFFEARKQRQAAKAAAKQAAQQQAQFQDWQENADALNAMLEIVRDCRNGKIGEQFTDTGDYGFMLKKGEFAVAFLQVGYLENVREPTRYSGGYGGVSFPIFGKVRLNTGKTGGKITQGAESINTTDQGPLLITNQRIMFAGTKRSREWRFDKMMSCSHSPEGSSIFAMTGAAKPTGIAYGRKAATEVQFRIELASAIALDTLDRYEAELVAERTQLEAERPLPPPPNSSTTS